MIWIKIKALEEQISKDELTEKDGFNYLLINLLYGVAVILVPTINGFNYVTITQFIINSLILIVFIKKLYRINASIDDRDFLKRFISISWVVRVRLVFYYLILNIIYFQFFSMSTFTFKNGIALIFISFIINFLFYFFLIKSFTRLKLLRQSSQN
ncbi:MAG: hypothetical protein KA210_02900 [Bacteroidia bacterium]|nr:hypothetical protein [Bacteroidia bacterium]